MTHTDIANLALSKIGESLIDDIDDVDDKNARKAKLHYEPALREVLRAHFWAFAMGIAEPLIFRRSTEVIVRIRGTITDGTDPVVFPELFPAGNTSLWTSDGLPDVAATGAWYSYAAASGGIITANYHLDGVSIAIMESNDPWDGTTDLETIELHPNPEGSGTGVATIDLTTARDLRPWASAWTLPADFIKLRKIIDVAGNPIDKFDIRRIDGARRIVTGDYPEIFLDCVKYTDAPDEDPNFLQAFVTLLASRLARAITGNEELESKLLSQYEGRDLVNARLADAHDSQSNENHPLQEIIDGALINSHGSFF